MWREREAQSSAEGHQEEAVGAQEDAFWRALACNDLLC